MNEIDREFNKYAELRSEAKIKDAQELRADTQSRLLQMFHANNETEAKTEKENDQTRAARIEAEIRRLRASAEQPELRPPGAPPPRHSMEVLKEKAQHNVALREEQQRLERAKGFMERVHRFIDSELEKEGKSKEQADKPLSRSQQIRKEMDEFRRKFPGRDFERER